MSPQIEPDLGGIGTGAVLSTGALEAGGLAPTSSSVVGYSYRSPDWSIQTPETLEPNGGRPVRVPACDSCRKVRRRVSMTRLSII